MGFLSAWAQGQEGAGGISHQAKGPQRPEATHPSALGQGYTSEGLLKGTRLPKLFDRTGSTVRFEMLLRWPQCR